MLQYPMHTSIMLIKGLWWEVWVKASSCYVKLGLVLHEINLCRYNNSNTAGNEVLPRIIRSILPRVMKSGAIFFMKASCNHEMEQGALVFASLYYICEVLPSRLMLHRSHIKPMLESSVWDLSRFRAISPLFSPPASNLWEKCPKEMGVYSERGQCWQEHSAYVTEGFCLISPVQMQASCLGNSAIGRWMDAGRLVVTRKKQGTGGSRIKASSTRW